MSDSNISAKPDPIPPYIDGVHIRAPYLPSVHVTQIGVFEADRFWHDKTFTNPFWRAYTVNKAGLYYESAQQGRQPYRTQAITIIPPWCSYHFSVTARVEHTLIHFVTPDLPGALLRQHFPLPLSLSKRLLRTYFHEFTDQLKQASSSYCQGLLADVLARLCLHECLNTLTAPARKELTNRSRSQRLQVTLDHIHKNLGKSIAIGDLAQTIKVGKAQCIRIFKQELGQTPAQTIRELRVVRAAQLLTSSTHSLDHIAESCGFGNRHYFSRVFKRHMHMSPAAYRRQNSQAHGD